MSIILIVIALVLAERAISYHCTVLGLIYYLGMKHNDVISAEKVKELRNYALERRVEELFGRR